MLKHFSVAAVAACGAVLSVYSLLGHTPLSRVTTDPTTPVLAAQEPTAPKAQSWIVLDSRLALDGWPTLYSQDGHVLSVVRIHP
jgi:hypothetical protein